MKEKHRRGSLVGPMILIALGVVFLLNNLGILPWSIWEVILRLWPILLIGIGLDLLLGRRSVLGSLLALILTSLILAGALWLMGTDLGVGSSAPGQEISQSLEGATRAEVSLKFGAGSLRARALPETGDLLLDGVIRPRGRENVERDFSVRDGTATLVLRSAEPSFGPILGGAGGPTWDLALNRQIPIDLQAEVGAGEVELDLSELQVSNLRVTMGLGQTTVILPAEGRFQAFIEGAIGQTTIIIPRDMAARVQADTGIASRQAPEGYQRQGDLYTSSDYEGADNRVDLVVSQAIGNLVIRHPE
jgi:hypothetical protein